MVFNLEFLILILFPLGKYKKTDRNRLLAETIYELDSSLISFCELLFLCSRNYKKELNIS